MALDPRIRKQLLLRRLLELRERDRPNPWLELGKRAGTRLGSEFARDFAADRLGLEGGPASGAAGTGGGLLGRYAGQRFGGDVGGQVGQGLGSLGGQYAAENLLNTGATYASGPASAASSAASTGSSGFASSVPWAALATASRIGGKELQESGSPQVRGLGRTMYKAGAPFTYKQIDPVLATKDPVKFLFDEEGALAGAANSALSGGPAVQAVLEGIGIDFNPVRDIFGIGKPPTTGTQFGNQLEQILPGMDVQGYRQGIEGAPNPEDLVERFGPEAFETAGALGDLFASPSGVSQENPGKRYGVQAMNVLLGNMGRDVVDQGPALARALGIQTPEDAMELLQRQEGIDPEVMERNRRIYGRLFG